MIRPRKTIPFSDFVQVNPVVRMEHGQEYPFVEMADIVPGHRFVTARRVRELCGGARFEVGDILFARITPCLENGKIGQFAAHDVTKGFGSTEFIVFRARPGVSDSAYVYYLSLTDQIRKPAEKSMAGASGRQRADIEVIRQIQVPATPLPLQRTIAGLLEAYDRLIENNTRRVRILEDMVQAIYREWFIHFRFPGHKKVKPANSPLGPIPHGWEVKRATDAITVDPPTLVPREGEKPFVPMSSLSSDSMLVHDFELRTGNSGSKFRNGDTLFARITPCLENGKTAFVQFLPTDQDVAFGSTEFIVLRSKTLCPEFVYLLSRSADFRSNAIKSMSGASGRQRVQPACFDKLMFAHPDQKTLGAFAEQVFPMFQAVQVLATKNGNLRKTRDLLLPKLISGELDVSKMVVAGERGWESG